MTLDQAKKITADIALEYLGDKWKSRLSSGQAAIWHEAIRPMKNKEAILEAKRKLFICRPSYKPENNFHMPDVDLFKNYYEQEIASLVAYCPCCQNTDRVFFRNRSLICECQGKDGVLSCYCPLECSPTEEYPCPLGEERRTEAVKKALDEIKADPAYERGKEYLKGIQRDMLDKNDKRTNGLEKAIKIPKQDKETTPF